MDDGGTERLRFGRAGEEVKWASRAGGDSVRRPSGSVGGGGGRGGGVSRAATDQIGIYVATAIGQDLTDTHPSRRHDLAPWGLDDRLVQFASQLPAADDYEFRTRLASLTNMQLVTTSLVAGGYQNKRNAWECKIAEATVKAHVSEALRRLGMISRTEAAVSFALLIERIRRGCAHEDHSRGGV